jgi:hypothetical protein
MRHRIYFIAILLVFGSPAGAAEDKADLTADQIVKKANFTAYYQGADGRARVSMTIVDAQGRKRERELTILRRDSSEAKDIAGRRDERSTGAQKFYVYFHKPADVERMTYLVHKTVEVGKDDDRWLFLPKVDLVKRIAGSEKRTSFVGSNFFYEDISGRNPALDAHELAGTTKSYYVLKSTPKDKSGVEFAYYKTWIHKQSFLVVKTVYYDSNEKAYRQYQATSVKQVQGYWTVLKARMTDLQTRRYTDVEYSGVKYDIDVPEDVFTERYLRRPPQKYLENEG